MKGRGITIVQYFRVVGLTPKKGLSKKEKKHRKAMLKAVKKTIK